MAAYTSKLHYWSCLMASVGSYLACRLVNVASELTKVGETCPRALKVYAGELGVGAQRFLRGI
jgi:hypothetical protein